MFDLEMVHEGEVLVCQVSQEAYPMFLAAVVAGSSTLALSFVERAYNKASGRRFANLQKYAG